tara:strand:- start:1595 stop:1756 length:162 start_codon:yes stop_codon:yes gene_type:complete
MDHRDALWDQAIRLVRAYDNASRAGNQNAAKIHRAALYETLKKLGVVHYGKNT